MKFMKKIMAAVAVSAVAVLSFASLTASADLKARDEAPYNAFLAIQAGGDSKWVSSTDDPAVVAQKNSITEATEATITGDGSYSVDVTMVNGSETIEAMILSTNINAYSLLLRREHLPRPAVCRRVAPQRWKSILLKFSMLAAVLHRWHMQVRLRVHCVPQMTAPAFV